MIAVRVSIDKDILNLQGLNYNWKKGEFLTVTEESAKTYFWLSMITGDSIDNIKGLPNKGIKYFNKLLEDNLGVPIESLVFNEYIQHFGEYQGIKEFYKNYISLKILSQKEDFIVPEPVEFKKKEISVI